MTEQQQITREQVLEATLSNPIDYYVGAALDDLLAYTPGEGPDRIARIMGFLSRLHTIETQGQEAKGSDKS